MEELDSHYLIVATSELAVNLGGPVIRVGSLATTRFPLSIVKMKALLKPPSFFLIFCDRHGIRAELNSLCTNGHRN